MKQPEAATFWMVWRAGSRDCSFQHWCRENADLEAQRLARHTPGEMFFVLKSAAGYQAQVLPVAKAKMLPPAEDDGIPF